MTHEFERVDKLAYDKFVVRKDKYGDSWKTVKLWQLQVKLREECAELLDATDNTDIHKEALDVMNMARMIAERTIDS